MSYTHLLSCLHVFEGDELLLYRLAKEYDVSPSEIEKRYTDTKSYWHSILKKQPVEFSANYQLKLQNLTASFCALVETLTYWRHPQASESQLLHILTQTDKSLLKLGEYLQEIRFAMPHSGQASRVIT